MQWLLGLLALHYAIYGLYCLRKGFPAIVLGQPPVRVFEALVMQLLLRLPALGNTVLWDSSLFIQQLLGLLALDNAIDGFYCLCKGFPVIAQGQRPMRVLEALVVVDDVSRAAGNPLGGEQAFHAHWAARMDAPCADAHLRAAWIQLTQCLIMAPMTSVPGWRMHQRSHTACAATCNTEDTPQHFNFCCCRFEPYCSTEGFMTAWGDVVAKSGKAHLSAEAKAEAVCEARGHVVEHARAVDLAQERLRRVLVLCTHPNPL